MEKFKIIYKCRMCGKEFLKREIKDDFQAQRYLGGMCVQYKGNNLPFEFHRCEDGSFGFGDLIGCRRVEENEEN